MMKSFNSIFIFCLLGIFVSTAGVVVAQEEGGKDKVFAGAKIENSRTRATLELAELVDALSNSDVIFLGEQHDNDSGHEFQLQVIKGLAEKGHAIAISMEQFERDVQGAINDYLNGRLSENEFLKASRPWKNYAKHYRPVIEYAKQNKISVIAANIPRRVASTVAQAQQPAITDRVYLPRQTSADKNAYWTRFEATMAGHMGVEGKSKLEDFFKSQCLKDDAMAESITEFLAVNSHRQKIVVHLCGHFHSDYGLGTVARVVKRRPLARITVATMESKEKYTDQQVQSSLHERAHFIFWTVENQQENKIVESKEK